MFCFCVAKILLIKKLRGMIFEFVSDATAVKYVRGVVFEFLGFKRVCGG